jgi:hypothetical protein
MDDHSDEIEMSVLLEGVIELHEVFVTLRHGGFTEDQSLKLIANVLSNNGGFPYA